MKHSLTLAVFIFCSIIFGQSTTNNYIEDVQSIDAIIYTYYNVVSGYSNEPWQFERDKFIHSPNAQITRLDENGNAETHFLEAEYIPMGLSPREDFLRWNLNEKPVIMGIWHKYGVPLK